MNIEDYGIVLSSYKYGDSGIVVKLLSREHGVVKGLIKGQKKHNGIIQNGNLVHFNWSARLSEHLGMLNLELEKAYTLLFFSQYQKILSISSLCGLMDALLPDRENYSGIFDNFVNYMNNLDEDAWLSNHVLMEVLLLDKTGFGFDLERCAVSGTKDNITYISPKSGSAVSQEIGEPYKNKLFKIPSFLLDNEDKIVQKHSENMQEIIDGLEITQYFFAKYFFAENLAKLPSSCLQFRDEINRNFNVKERENRDSKLQGSA
jgi:DNA repair protein RecO (recombination protein O)